MLPVTDPDFQLGLGFLIWLFLMFILFFASRKPKEVRV